MLCVLLLLTACRSSPVLQETIYMQSAPEIDEEQETLLPDDTGEEDEEFDNQEDLSAETMRDTAPDAGLSQEEGSADGSVSQEGVPAPGEAAGTTPEYVSGGETAWKQVVDGSGQLREVPENVETVTAVGAAAQMVEMLGGAGRLLGSNRDLLDSPLAQAAFPDWQQIQAWWPGDGESGIPDAAFAALLEAQPDVCLEISGAGTFSNSQAAQLAEHEIAYVVLPPLSSQENLKSAVSIVAQIMGENRDTGEAAEAIARRYCDWADGVLQEVSGKTSGNLTSLYLCGWDESAEYQLNYTKGVIDARGSGLAVAYSPIKAQMASTYMNAAHVTNESTRIRSIHRDAAYVYVAPMFHQFDPVVTGSRAVFYSGAGEYGSAFDLFVARMVSDSVYYQLGSDAYRAVIAADESVKQQIENNWFWQYHESDASGYITQSGQRFYCGVVGPYEIYVNPQGMCDWAGGSLESPLEAYWVAHKFYGAFSMETVREETASFYRTFFAAELSDAQLSAILGE